MSIQITSCSSCEINGIRYRIPRATPGASELLKKPLWRENREAADTQAGAKGQSLPANPQASYRVTRRDTSWVIQECRWLSVGPRGRGGEDLGCTPVHIRHQKEDSGLFPSQSLSPLICKVGIFSQDSQSCCAAETS